MVTVPLNVSAVVTLSPAIDGPPAGPATYPGIGLFPGVGIFPGLGQIAGATSGGGDGTAQIGPIGMREVWTLSAVFVKTSQADGTIVNEGTCKTFVGSDATDPNYVGGTLTGSTWDSSANMAGMTVSAGEYVFARWTGGDPGVQARLNVLGTKVISGARAL